MVKCKNGYTFALGEMAEWSIAAVLKTVELRGSGGSNPSLSAENKAKDVEFGIFLYFIPPRSKSVRISKSTQQTKTKLLR